MHRLSLLLVLVPVLVFSSCRSGRHSLDIDASAVKIDPVVIHRYDRDIFSVNRNDLRNGLENLKGKYSFFLGTDLGDTSKLREMREYLDNPRNADFARSCGEFFPGMKAEETQLTEAFRHVKYYFPETRIPRVYTYISGGDYQNPVILADSVMLIALDAFLGSGNKAYQSDGLSLYLVQRMVREQIVPSCMREMAARFCPEDPSALNLLDQMVNAGKRLYVLEAFLPTLADNIRMNYTPEQSAWCLKNESHIWAAIIENKMLYSTDSKVSRMFLTDGPCTQEFGKESAPRLGEWIGLRIIESYMGNNSGVTLQELLAEKDAQQILTRSGYKPEK
jgi:hypothetical protein